VALSSLHHAIDLKWMKEAYRLTRKDGAPGIDGVGAADYATNLEANLLDLLDRIQSGRYKAPPVRRTYIPKTDGSRRPLLCNHHLVFDDEHAHSAQTDVCHACDLHPRGS
jgi:RNA-directed DNA polymerase